MTKIFPPPEFGAPVAAAYPSDDAARLLSLRRSTSVELLGEPGPDPATIETICRLAARVPDHRKVVPFRFIVYAGEGRRRAGAALAEAFRVNEPTADETKVAAEAGRFLRAPVVIGVVSRVDPTHRTPEWEQILTAGAVAYGVLLAASAYGFAGTWITEWYGYDRKALDGLGFAPAERAAGFVYLGTAQSEPRERQRPDLAAISAYF
jgi:nitroreductase